MGRGGKDNSCHSEQYLAFLQSVLPTETMSWLSGWVAAPQKTADIKKAAGELFKAAPRQTERISPRRVRKRPRLSSVNAAGDRCAGEGVEQIVGAGARRRLPPYASSMPAPACAPLSRGLCSTPFALPPRKEAMQSML
jgi:hypothetical protein